MEDENHEEESYAGFSDTSLNHGDDSELFISSDLPVMTAQPDNGYAPEDVGNVDSGHSMQHQTDELPNGSQASSGPSGSTSIKQHGE